MYASWVTLGPTLPEFIVELLPAVERDGRLHERGEVDEVLERPDGLRVVVRVQFVELIVSGHGHDTTDGTISWAAERTDGPGAAIRISE